MKPATLFLLPTAVAASALHRHVYSRSANRVINTTQGLLQGGPSEYVDGVTSYKGIPFASPPTGSNRWKAPQTAASWTGVRNATAFGLQCAQAAGTVGIFESASTESSEDCLTLNIWTPAYNGTSDLASKNLPVYFWIFGGRFEIGSGDVPTYDGSTLAAQDIIVVTMNYRLGAFGFLAHPDLSAESGHNSSGNYGILDQQAALQWVHDNIANFGGNPNQVTVGGQSAGSASSLAAMWSPLTKGLVHGIIAESGARGPRDPLTGSLATSHRNKTHAEAQGVDFLATMNVTSIEELRALDTATLTAEGTLSDTIFVGTQFEDAGSAFLEPPVWRPVIDGYVLPYTYGEALRTDAHLDVPVMTGNNHDESGASPSPGMTVDTYNGQFEATFEDFSSDFFCLYPANTTDLANNQTNAFFRDLSRVSTFDWAVDWAAGGASSDVFVYFFSHTPASNAASGTYHGAELWYTFGNIPWADWNSTDVWTDADYAVKEVVQQYWINFISYGNPNGKTNSSALTYFPPTTNETRQVMFLGDSYGAEPLVQGTDADAGFEFINSWFDTLLEY